MTDEKLYTARDLAKAQQSAFVHGVSWYALNPSDYDIRHEAAAERYPTPKITRPRETVMFGMPYRCVDGALQFRAWDGSWKLSITTPDEVAQLFDLIQNPTEEVDA